MRRRNEGTIAGAHTHSLPFVSCSASKKERTQSSSARVSCMMALDARRAVQPCRWIHKSRAVQLQPSQQSTAQAAMNGWM